MSGLGGLNKSPNGVVIGMVQLQLPTVVTKDDLAAYMQSGTLSGFEQTGKQLTLYLVELPPAGLQQFEYDLVATMVPGAGSIKQGLNDKSRHSKFMEDFRANIQAAAEYKWPNVICMAGDRTGISDEEGMDNCRAILKEAVKIAEDSNVTICMEMLNSKVNHPGYMCDNYAWAFGLCRREQDRSGSFGPAPGW